MVFSASTAAVVAVEISIELLESVLVAGDGGGGRKGKGVTVNADDAPTGSLSIPIGVLYLVIDAPDQSVNHQSSTRSKYYQLLIFIAEAGKMVHVHQTGR